jgi:transposase InsO family protein
MMCRVLKVSPSGYYAWQQREQSPHEHVDEALRAQIVEIHEASRGTHGSPRIHRDLSERGHRTSRKRAARLIRESAIVVRVRRRFVRTTDSNHPHPIAPNRLERDFTVAAPDQCGVGDITYLWTGEGWLYLAVWLDLLSRRIVGWSMADHLRSELALGALEVAIGHRNSSEGVVHHTDRGSQYASDEYRA